MGEYFPDLFPTLAQDGAIPVGTEGVRWNQLGVWMAPVRGPVKALFQSRPFLEQHVRDQLAARDNVRIRDACEVSQVCAHNDRITASCCATALESSTRKRCPPTSLWMPADAVRVRHNGSTRWGMGMCRKPASKSMLDTPRASIAALHTFPPIGRGCSSMEDLPATNAGESSSPSRAAAGWSRW